jgi:hypothetical protein
MYSLKQSRDDFGAHRPLVTPVLAAAWLIGGLIAGSQVNGRTAGEPAPQGPFGRVQINRGHALIVRSHASLSTVADHLRGNRHSVPTRLASQAEWQTRLLPALAEQMYLETSRCQHAQAAPARKLE